MFQSAAEPTDAEADLRIIRLVLLTVSAAVALTLGATMAVRAFYLPVSECLVTKASVDTIELRMDYGGVVRALGCEGVRVKRDDWGEIVREVYQWRGAAWPFGRLQGEFYTQPGGAPLVLHKTEVHWLDIVWSKAGLPEVAGRLDGATLPP